MNLIPFNFNGADLRVITDDHGEPWFVAMDVASTLGYSNTSDAVARHCKAVQILKSQGATFEVPNRGLQIIPERDLYRLIMSSQLQSAQEFEEWVVSEVLPTIRKTGGYQRPMTPGEQLLAQAQAVINIERRQVQQQEDLSRVEQKVDTLGRFHVWDYCPQNCLSLTGVKSAMNERYGLSSPIVDYVLKTWPHQPNAAGMVRNGHEDAKGSQYMVWSKTNVTAAFKRFVSECQMESATQATHPYFEGRFRLVQKGSK